MATTRSLSTASTASASPVTGPAARGARHRLRAVDRDEVVEIADFLPPGATWLPAPPHALPALPGRPPMVGYLVLVPAGQQPPFAPAAVPAGPERPAPAEVTAEAPAPERGAESGDPLVRIDPVRRTAEVDGRRLDLTYLEFELLAHLVAHPHRVHTRDQLVTTVWGYGHVGDGRTVDVHVARLRRKLGTEHRAAIQTVRRVGYKYTPPTGA
ncbi:winged helix-turn-helix domain-containing protein [Streptomyces griseoaurantiacus]|uniref:winged helix-turn-helix domain-containing protein n=1 Tax=Streptomyces TaxID=1883 RepID=UPI001F31FF1D|nr:MULTISPECIES: winged helix-turn-helix domain-containing protein [Streptomyces]MCF0090037.1 Alkaline phosphatase synthesis transcriptional regulatory protein PhoP [Streptomyces sp. MH192]MCF0102227.1 Alkaline phosphatase synthesis transcriptional regulatory protein PhoP [Streptomyces sp. MH191]MDX3092747.1 winged helix-turn-helix domain-containing protein [Streptomyces sp. ME12-02E]MDX3333946.1 winged helix-turn-helix domain-containing protein [Streptomyces sp. ME02-6978a]